MKVSNPTLKRLLDKYQSIATLNQIGYILEWDMNVNLPSKAAESRGTQSAFVAEGIATRWQDPKVVELLDALDEQRDSLNNLEQAILRVLNRASKIYRKVPKELIIEKAKTTSEAFMVWQKAKTDDKFEDFAPYLERIIKLNQDIAGRLGFQDNPYDALLDLYDQDLTAGFVESTFNKLQPELTALRKKIQAAPNYRSEEPLVSEPMVYPQEAQRQLGLFVLKKMGYDFDAGRMDVSAHPFSTELGPGDTRITTRYLPHDFRSAFSATMHEGGHALYTQGINPEFAPLSLEDELSFAIHESQSRFWENQVGRHPAFIQYMTPLFQAFFPDQLGHVGADELIPLFNQVKPGLIRIEADEVTYALHIILRFELENDLINNELAVKDLPDAWNAKVKQYLGLTPPNNREGVLQDVHWSNGYIGYFPSYALGNLYAAQFTHKLKQDLPFDDLVARAELGTILDWLRENIHQYGSRFTAKELVIRITGEDLNLHYFIDYLKEKFGTIYKI